MNDILIFVIFFGVLILFFLAGRSFERKKLLMTKAGNLIVIEDKDEASIFLELEESIRDEKVVVLEVRKRSRV